MVQVTTRRRSHQPALTLPTALALLLGLAAVTGCGSSTPVRPDRFYRLDPAPQVGRAGPPTPAILLVNDLAARGLIGGRQILFRTREQPQLTQRYEDLLWEEPPTSALARGLVEALRAAGVFRFVVVPAERARADWLLGGELTRFEHLPTDRPPRVAAELHLALVSADDRGYMESRTYSGEEPVDGSTPDAMAAAFTRLSARLIAQVVRDLQSRPGRHASGMPPRDSSGIGKPRNAARPRVTRSGSVRTRQLSAPDMLTQIP
jgi:cholesterol transport system auxiliary component